MRPPLQLHTSTSLGAKHPHVSNLEKLPHRNSVKRRWVYQLMAVSKDHIGKQNAPNFPYLFPSYRFIRKWVVSFRQLLSFKIGALATVCHDKRRKASNKTYHSCLGGCLFLWPSVGISGCDRNCSIIAARSNQNNI